MPHNERVTVLSFSCESADPESARMGAVKQLDEWYADRTALFDVNGQTLFQFSESLLVTPGKNYLCTITVFDARMERHKD